MDDALSASSSNEGALPILPEMSEIWQQTVSWQPNEDQQAQFQQLYEQILLGNRQLNLTRITEPQEFWEKHLWDSLRGIKSWLGDGAAPRSTPFRVIDIGTGGGFPGIPVAIACPDWHLTLLDSTRKKMAFLDLLLPHLGLESQVQTLTDRAEQVGQQSDHRETYDLALIRAVAVAPVCAEYALPLLKVGGMAILYRGQWTDAETIALKTALGQLRGTLEAIDSFTTPLSHGMRHCLLLKKVAPTPKKFPRPVGVAVQKPLSG